MLASSRTGLALYFTPSSSARQRAHIVLPYGWDACFMSVTHYKPTCREWSQPFWDFVLAEAEPAGTIRDSNSVESILNRIWKSIQRPRLEFTKESLHLRPELFNRIQIRTIWWKINVSNLRAVQQIFYCLCMVRLHIIHYENRVSVISLFLKSQSTSAVLLKIAINYST